jgi:type II secretory pathway pseudopilin PulG
MNAAMLHAGMALVESLVAITLLGVGLGGSAALLVQAIGNEREATLRAMALRQANSLADELRAVLRDRSLPIAVAQGAGPDCAGPDGTCAPDEWIAWRVADWQGAALAGLPEGTTAVVDLLDASRPAYRVTLAWPGRDPASPTRVKLVVEP